jgi:hypothetical protein
MNKNNISGKIQKWIHSLNIKRFSLVIFVVLFGSVGVYRLLSSSASTPPTLAFYRGAPGGTNDANQAGKGIDQVSTWLGRDVLYGEDFEDISSWSGIEGPSWQLGSWGPWVNAKAGRNLILSVAPMPTSGGLLTDCASGAYNSHWKLLGQNLVANKLPNTYLRFGWEMNGSWYPWYAFNGNQSAFIGCYQQFVNTMRSVPGTNFKQVWNPNGGWSGNDLSTIYPGDSYVDFIATDDYDQSWAANTYPYPSPCDSSCMLTHQQNAWNDILNAQGGGLNWFVNFAKTHGKPLGIGEWGLMNRSDGHGGLDDPYYVQQMTDFVNNTNNNVAWHVFFDFNGGGALQVSPVPLTYATTAPNSQAKLKSLYQVTVPIPTSDTTPPAVSITAPTNGSTVSGNIKPQASASDNIGVTKVEFYLDGALAQTDTSAPYCLTGDTNGVCNDWNTKNVPNGLHTLLAKAYDAAGNTNQVSVSFTVNNTLTVADTTPPSVSINTPANGSYVSGKVTVSSSATDNIGVTWMDVKIDNTLYASGSTDSISFTWNTRKVARGSHTITVEAKDAAGNLGTKSIVVYK